MPDDAASARRAQMRGRVWIGLGLLAVSLVIVAIFAVPGDEGSTGDGGSDLPLVIALISAIGTLVGGIASLVSAAVMMVKLRQSERPPPSD